MVFWDFCCCLSKLHAEHGAWTQDPQIKNCMFYWLRQPGTPYLHLSFLNPVTVFQIKCKNKLQWSWFFFFFLENLFEKSYQSKTRVLGTLVPKHMSVLSAIQSPLNWADTVWLGLRCASFCQEDIHHYDGHFWHMVKKIKSKNRRRGNSWGFKKGSKAQLSKWASGSYSLIT